MAVAMLWRCGMGLATIDKESQMESQTKHWDGRIPRRKQRTSLLINPASDKRITSRTRTYLLVRVPPLRTGLSLPSETCQKVQSVGAIAPVRSMYLKAAPTSNSLAVH